ncbi:hypothetical protein [Pedobacter rhizosphaerae]|uniref:Uncharacterized protein n=1 Tax=Pedobacter rhizosphaerae TaxID=390241 RepID=A0A1H9T0C0_9SPHI|nr:hypothetical protein [Pedobacter rhizosphaerae]SER90464.1 hypothetical protein SAMN04488023_12025 [Pedobacter rhizosphaerae]
MRRGWNRFSGKGNLRESPLKDEQINKNYNELSFRLARVILRRQSELAGYFNAKASKISATRMRIILICVVLIVAAYCLYLIWGSLVELIK